tara:strand:- start:1105 stop:2082 length:978 start_codon:yes stop_codon:yes gene_type:complete
MEDLKKLEDHKFDDLKAKLELEIENLKKYVKPAELSIEELEKVEPLDEKKIENFKAEIELLEKEILERDDQIKLIDAEVKHRVNIRLLIENALKELNFDEEEVHKRWDREKDVEVEYVVPIIDQFLHQMEFCDHVELKEELRVDGILQLDDEGLPIEVVKEIKHIPWNKKAILKELKLKLDLDKANLLVLRVKDYKHNKKKGELESKLRLLVQNNVYFLEAFGEEIEIIKGERHGVHHSDRIAKWDKDDLPLFEEKILKLELAKSHLDEKERIQKPIDDRIREYKQIDGQLLEALIEKLEEDRPEKMVEYLKLRKEIKDKHPLED